MNVKYLILPLLALPFAVYAQTMDVDDAQSKPFIASVQPPEDLRNWTPKAKQFRLYINTQGRGKNVVPNIDILSAKGSWPFVMKHIDDTVYLYIVYIVPLGYTLQERSVLDQLPDTFPLVVWAGTERAVYMFSYDNGKITLDATQSASFLSLVDIRPLPENVICWQLQGTGKSADEVQWILQELGNQAKLIQLKKGFYQGEWLYITETSIRTWKLNETSTGTLLALELADASSREEVSKQLRKYTATK